MRRAWIFVSLCLAGCATAPRVGAPSRTQAPRHRPPTPATSRPTPLHTPRPGGGRHAVLARARALVGKQRLVLGGREFPATCNGLVEAAYAPTGLRLDAAARPGDNAVTALHRLAQAQGRLFRDGPPAPGDLVFFRDTYDQNRDGRSNDGLTHVGLVESVDRDGTVTLIHHVSRGVARYRMNPARPTFRKDPRTGRVLNQTLRRGKAGRSPALTGELFVTYASLLPGDAALVRR